MIENPKAVVAEQALDAALWLDAPRIVEAMLQTALRRLHAAVEGEDWRGQTGEFAE